MSTELNGVDSDPATIGISDFKSDHPQKPTILVFRATASSWAQPQ